MKSGWFNRLSPTKRKIIIAVIPSLIVVIAAAFLSPMIAKLFQESDASDLQLEDARIIATDKFPQLEIILKNNGEKKAIITDVVLRVELLCEVPYPPDSEPVAPGHMDETWKYDFEFTSSNLPYQKSVYLPRGIEPEETERFVITLKPDVVGTDGHVFLVTATLIGGAHDKTLTTNVMFEVGAACIFSQVPYDMPLPEGSSLASDFPSYGELAQYIDDFDARKSGSLERALQTILADED
jgi:hypothetical protein